MNLSLLLKKITLALLTIMISFSVFSQVEVIPGEAIVRLEKDVVPERIISQLPESYNAEIDRVLSRYSNIWLFTFDEDVEVQTVIDELYRTAGVELAQVNTPVELRQAPNDPQYGNQWQHQTIDSEDAWDITTGGTSAHGEDIVVCIIESANVMGHPDLVGNHWTNTAEVADGTDTDGNGYVDDINGWNVGTNDDNIGTGNHGTSVAGMIGAVGNNGTGVAGANWDVKMMVVAGQNAQSQASVVAAYSYPLEMRALWNQTNGAEGAFVVATNASWGIDGADPNNYPIWCGFYDDLGQEGILNCGATSNNSNINVDTDGDVPTGCASDYMVGVASTNQNEQVVSAGGQNTIDVAAPGANIYTTENGGYGYTSGTSFASPLTAGVIGLMYSIPCEDFMDFVKADPQGAADAVRLALYDGVYQSAHLSSEVIHGRINAKNAIDILMDQLCDLTPEPPVCDFSASATTIEEGQSIDFTDESTGIPDTWSWTFDGGNPATSTVQNPTGITWDTQGTYTVTLEASNDEGTCTTDIQITVIEPQHCDTLNFPPPGSLVIYPQMDDGDVVGYITGNNTFGDENKAERFDNYGANTHVTEMFVYFYSAYDGGNGASVNFNVRDEAGGEPGNVLAQVSVSMTDLGQAIPGGGGIITIPFQEPVNVGGNPFYLDVEMVDLCFDNSLCNVDSLGIVSNTGGDSPGSGTAWETWNGDWGQISDAWQAVNGGISLFISAAMTDMPPEASASVDQMEVCLGQELNFDGSGSTNGLDFEWVIPGANPDGGVGTTFTTSFDTEGTYDAYLIVDGYCGSYAVDSIVGIEVTDGILADVTLTDANCGVDDGVIEIDVVGGGTFEYSIDDGANFSTDNVFNDLAAGTYEVVVSDGGTCEYTETVIIDNAGGPEITSVNAVDVDCYQSCDGSITIEATGGSQYSIDGGDNFQVSNEFTGLCAGTYNIVVDDGAGCISNETALVEQPNELSINVSETHTSCGDDNGEIQVIEQGGNGPFEYSIDGGTNTQTNNTFSGLEAGTYQVVVIDANGCESTTEVVEITPSTAIQLTETSTDDSCDEGNGSATVNATGGDGAYSYSWNPNVSTSNTANNLTEGIYTVVVEDGSGCSETITITIDNDGGVNASINASNQSICEGQSVSITASGGASYEWSNGETTSSISVSPEQTTTYTVTVTDGDCSEDLSTTIEVVPTPVTTVNPEYAEVCVGESVTLTAGGGDSYFWQFGETTPSITVAPDETTSYTVIASNGSCQGDPATAIVSTLPSPTAVATADNDTVYLPQDATVNFSSGGSTASGYEWSFGDGSPNSNAPNPSHTYNVAGDFTVILTVTFDNGCTDSDTIHVHVSAQVSIEENDLANQINLYPNPIMNEQLNLEFNLSSHQDVTIRIFSSLGQLVYSEVVGGIQNTVHEVDVRGFGAGMYFVNMSIGDDIVVKKVTIQ